jgi:Ni,Fe-hydrogenase I large subunit
MATVKIAPFNRLEGHLDLHAETVNLGAGFANEALVTDANNMVVMFRGIENIMFKRDPRDAPIIAPRT